MKYQSPIPNYLDYQAGGQGPELCPQEADLYNAGEEQGYNAAKQAGDEALWEVLEQKKAVVALLKEQQAEIERLRWAASFKSNVIIRDEKRFKGDWVERFKGDWVAVPKQDFDSLRTARAPLTEEDTK